MTIGLVSTALAAAALVLLGPALRWWGRRAWTDPRRDPGAARVSTEARRALEALITDPRQTPSTLVAAALEVCEIDDLVSWRGGLAQVQPAVATLGVGVDDQALAAEFALRLGRVDEARAQVAPLPADHWRACRVRAGLYTIAGDAERAESAWVAVAQLGPPAGRAAAYARLEASRRRRGASVPRHVGLWERPPE
jgi:hypothetical protein